MESEDSPWICSITPLSFPCLQFPSLPLNACPRTCRCMAMGQNLMWLRVQKCWVLRLKRLISQRLRAATRESKPADDFALIFLRFNPRAYTCMRKFLCVITSVCHCELCMHVRCECKCKSGSLPPQMYTYNIILYTYIYICANAC
jgi:hypothetical protein